MIISGIYSITNIANGHRYIGSSVSVNRRWNEHKRMLRNGKHHSISLQRAWDKYGESSFSFDFMRHIEGKDSCILVEQEFMDTLHPEYNIAPKAISPGGFIMTDATREKHRINSARLAKNKDWLDKVIRALRSGQLAAAEWHRSSEGRMWAKKNYETSLAITHIDHDLFCIQCGKAYRGEHGKYCSKKCAAKWRREHGADDVTRICLVCGKEFVINKYKHTSTCSKSCSQSRRIIQFDTNGNILKGFKNAHEAGAEIGIDFSNICKCLRGVYKSAGGFIWKYAQEGQQT